jgi:hypothetical protein
MYICVVLFPRTSGSPSSTSTAQHEQERVNANRSALSGLAVLARQESLADPDKEPTSIDCLRRGSVAICARAIRRCWGRSLVRPCACQHRQQGRSHAATARMAAAWAQPHPTVYSKYFLGHKNQQLNQCSTAEALSDTLLCRLVPFASGALDDRSGHA